MIGRGELSESGDQTIKKKTFSMMNIVICQPARMIVTKFKEG